MAERIGWILCTLLVLAACDKGSEAPAEQPGETQKEEAKNKGEATNAEGDETTEPEADEPGEPRIVYAEGPRPAPDTVLAASGPLEITLADFDEAMRRSIFSAPTPGNDPDALPRQVPAENLAAPHVQLSSIHNLLANRIAVHEARERGMSATAAEKREALEGVDQMARWAPLLDEKTPWPEALSERSLERADLEAMAEEFVLRRELEAALVADIDDETLWKAYQRQHDTARLLLAAMPNTPSSAEIDRFAEAQSERIEAHFAEHRDRYRQPRLVRLTVLRPKAKPGQRPDLAALQKAADALADTPDPQAVAQQFGLEAVEGQAMVRDQSPEAFRSKVGETGVHRGPGRPYAWQVEGFRESEPAELDRPLRREIASELLREETVVTSVAEELSEVEDALANAKVGDDGMISHEAFEALKTALEPHGGQVMVVGPVRNDGRGYIPKVGLAEPIVERVFEADGAGSDVYGPVLSRQKAYVWRIIDRDRPSRDAFEADKAAFAEAFRERHRATVLRDFVESFQKAHKTRFDLKPLRIVYGTLQK